MREGGWVGDGKERGAAGSEMGKVEGAERDIRGKSRREAAWVSTPCPAGFLLHHVALSALRDEIRSNPYNHAVTNPENAW
jgi:hypothetical protein